MSDPYLGSEPVVVPVELTGPRALALAQMLKRLHWPDVRKLAMSDDEADLMIAALSSLQSALNDAGYTPP